MTFHSVLFEGTHGNPTRDSTEAPACFVDLYLDQIVDAVTRGKQEYNLRPFFYAPLTTTEAIAYRQEIARNIEDSAGLLDAIRAFARRMSEMRQYIALVDTLYYKYHKHGWYLEGVRTYCDAVACFVSDLALSNITSRGLVAFREYLAGYAGSTAFESLVRQSESLRGDLASIHYCVRIKDSRVRVRKYASETDYSIDVLDTFARFKHGAVKDYTTNLAIRSGMNHVEAQILDCLAKLYPDLFGSLEEFCAAHRVFVDETIAVFDREIQFYVAYLEHTAMLKRVGLEFCYPLISDVNKEIHVREGFDLALAAKRAAACAPVVCNDFYLNGSERVFVVSGPNQGGKTTFARMFGQLHFLASLGCPVPGKEARLFLCDRILAHFEKEEDIKNLRGKLQDDMIRMHALLSWATPSSIIIMNEIFTSTSLKDAVFLSKKVLETILNLDLLGVFVTFIDEFATLSKKTVSVVSTVVPDNPAQRTYKIERRPADGLAYALAIAEKYRLTYECLKERID